MNIKLLLSILMMAVAAAAGENNPATDWMAEAKIGAFMHFLPGQSNFPLVEKFDVPAVTKQLADSGVRYFVFTLGQNSGYMNAPNAAYDKAAGFAAGERCAKRDLPGELAAALKPHGIRLMLYLPCQTPNRDLQAIRAFGLPEAPVNGDRKIDAAFARKWSEVIREWSDRYGDAVSGWWFDGGYQHIGFNNEIAGIYSEAAKHGNTNAVVTFNPGVRLIRWTSFEDYTAGELNEPFTHTCSERWVSGSQWHVLTFLGKTWGHRDTRYPDEQWAKWVADVTARGGAVTLDMGPNYDTLAAPVGTFSEPQIKQLSVIVAATRNAQSPSITVTNEMPAYVDVYFSGKDGYNNYRIPAIEVAPDGSILAFAEARTAGDPGQGPNSAVDMVLKRSTDNGCTWSDMKVIEHPGAGWSAANPATAVDRETGWVWLLYLRCKPDRGTSKARPGTDDFQTFARHSRDNGLTWSEPMDLTEVGRDMKDTQWRATVIGPGGMIQDTKGRLIAAAWRVAPWGVFTIYSEDHGKTWRRSEVVPYPAGANKHSPNETQIVELSDGRILMDYRDESIAQRWMAESRDGAQTWSQPRAGMHVTPVACAIERYNLKSAGADRDCLIWTGPKGPKRNDLVARLSYDEGLTFPVERLFAAGPAAYSDLAILKDKTVGVLWERGNYKFISFTRLTPEFLESK